MKLAMSEMFLCLHLSSPYLLILDQNQTGLIPCRTWVQGQRSRNLAPTANKKGSVLVMLVKPDIFRSPYHPSNKPLERMAPPTPELSLSLSHTPPEFAIKPYGYPKMPLDLYRILLNRQIETHLRTLGSCQSQKLTLAR